MVITVGIVGCATGSDPHLGGDANGRTDADLTDGCATQAERCNDLDDDCDGHVDEDFATKGMACTLGAGACAASGHFVCAADGTLMCDAHPGTPTAEACDGIDNDCDAKVDEDFLIGTPCDGPDADTCADGVIACASPTTTMCTDGPDDSPEICDGHDNDCDGHIDEGFNLGAACDGPDTDACNEGTIVCNGAGGATCSDMTGNNVELCNGLDDDCRNGVDELWNVGQACTVGLGMCARTGALMCNSAQTNVECSATPAAPQPELCGNGSDEDCNGADALCPSNDLPGGAIDISGGGTFTVDLSAAHDDNWTSATDCGNQGGRDVFYQFTLPAAEVIYFDTYASNFDTVVRVFAGSCTSLGALKGCADDACATTRSEAGFDLAAGTYCLVLDQFSSTTTAGAGSLTFKRGGRSGIALDTAGTSVAGTTTGKTNLSIAGCEANSTQPDVGYYYLTCPGSFAVSASTCTGTAFDTVLYMRNGSATSGDIACSDDLAGCGTGLQSRITNAAVTGPNLHWIIVDGFGTTGNGAYTMSYSIH